MNVRKQVARLTEGVYRVACLPENQDQPRPTFAVQKPEQFQCVEPSGKRKGEFLYELPDVTIRLKEDGQPFHQNNLKVEWKTRDKDYSWRPGQLDPDNLGGTYLSLDLWSDKLFTEQLADYDPMQGFDSHVMNAYSLLPEFQKALKKKKGKEYRPNMGYEELVHFHMDLPPKHFQRTPSGVKQKLKKIRKIPPGYLSRSGLTFLLDDSLEWDPKSNWTSGGNREEVGRNPDPVLYLVYYGLDYKTGLGRLTRLLGKLPQAPDWVLGVWFSCYRKMGEKAFIRQEELFRKHRLPLDVVVVDTDWHVYFWHGFDWNQKLFPDPDRFGRWLRKKNLHAPFNVHPHYIPDKDTRLDTFLKKTGVQRKILTEEDAENRFYVGNHRVDLFDKKQAEAYFDIFHKPIEKQACDMWWVDGSLETPDGRDATAWLNEMYVRKGPIDLVLSRTNGLGSHRATLQFTGDTRSQWKVLEQQVILTPKSSNCLLAYVSHDIGGFFKGSEEWPENKPPDDLYIRWTQFGCLSPIMRFHSDHGIREPWRFRKTTLEIVRKFLLLRRGLMPYLSQLAHEARRTGVGLCRPLYYEFPEWEEAYKYERQYFLGPALLVSPVCDPLSRVATWFPPGRWRHVFLDRWVEGPAVIEEKAPLDIAPIYFQEGQKIRVTRDLLGRKKDRDKKGISYQGGAESLTEFLGID